MIFRAKEHMFSNFVFQNNMFVGEPNMLPQKSKTSYLKTGHTYSLPDKVTIRYMHVKEGNVRIQC